MGVERVEAGFAPRTATSRRGLRFVVLAGATATGLCLAGTATAQDTGYGSPVIVNQNVLNALGPGPQATGLPVAPGYAPPGAFPMAGGQVLAYGAFPTQTGAAQFSAGQLLFPPLQMPRSTMTYQGAMAPPGTVMPGTPQLAQPAMPPAAAPVSRAAPALPQTASVAPPAAPQPAVQPPAAPRPAAPQPAAPQPAAPAPQAAQPSVPPAPMPQSAREPVTQTPPAPAPRTPVASAPISPPPAPTPAPAPRAAAPTPKPQPMVPPPPADMVTPKAPEPAAAPKPAAPPAPQPAAPQPAAPQPAAPQPAATPTPQPAPQPPQPAEAPTAAPEPTQQAALPPATSSEAALPDDAVRLEFAAGSQELTDQARGQLDQVAQRLKDDDDARIQLLAYAGGDEVNRSRRLSLSRALSVRSYLLGQGVRSTRMDVRALGNKATDGPPDRVDILPARR